MVPDVVRRHAPLVVLHRDERLLPASAEWFVSRASLRWATGHGLGAETVSEEGKPVELHRLGAASGKDAYRHGTSPASELTRPLEAAGRLAGAPVAQGFFLALRDKADARGAPSTSADRSRYTGAPVYYEYDRTAKAVTYWLFYAGSAPPLGILRAGEQIRMRPDGDDRRGPGDIVGELDPMVAAETLAEFVEAYPDLAAAFDDRRGLGDVVESLKLVKAGIGAYLSADNVLHQGDWERTTVYLDPDDPEGADPEAIGFYMHAAHTYARWTEIERLDQTHPQLYAAIGSHASLPSPDYGHIDVGDPDGPHWRTWEGDRALLAVADQPWYGFGGAWGSVGKVRDATGPLGPGARWKHAAPRPNDLR